MLLRLLAVHGDFFRDDLSLFPHILPGENAVLIEVEKHIREP